MPRYRLTLEYDGTPFVGWQVQAEGRSVAGTLAEAIRRFSGEEPSVRGAGRTDAGVHARGQVAHFDLAREWPPHTVRDAVNFHVRPWPIVVLACEFAQPGFDARRSATARHYLYRILNRRAPPALERDRLWWVPRPLDPTAMAGAGRLLVGRHDFTTFRAAACQAKSPIKTLDRLSVTSRGNEIHVEASARSFLHHQVRSMVGSLKHVGEGRWSVDDLARALAARNRGACGAVAPASGLYLTAVDYGPQRTASDEGEDEPS